MEEKPKIRSKKNMVKISVSSVIVLCIVFILASYLINDEFREMIDTKILKKEILENTANMIEINSDSNPYIYAFDKYITILSKNALTFYNQEATSVAKLDVNVTTPYMASSDKYCVLADDNAQKLYLISDTVIKWEKELDGQIYRVSVNSNGYVSVLLKNATYKSVIVVYNTEGEELLKVYLKKSYAVCSEVSANNKYLAIGQIDYSGTIVKSIVKIISIESVVGNAEDSVQYTYESESSKILNNIQFNDKNEAICMFDSYIQKITSSSDEKIYDINDGTLFTDINLGDNIITIEKENSGLFSYQYKMNIKSTTGKSDKLYILENDLPKQLKVSEDFICLKLVNEVRVVNSSGWLVKRYTTNSEIQNIVLSEKIMGIVYHNKIEVINI